MTFTIDSKEIRQTKEAEVMSHGERKQNSLIVRECRENVKTEDESAT